MGGGDGDELEQGHADLILANTLLEYNSMVVVSGK